MTGRLQNRSLVAGFVHFKAKVPGLSESSEYRQRQKRAGTQVTIEK